MIQLLATRYSKHIAGTFGCIIYMSMIMPAFGMGRNTGVPVINNARGNYYGYTPNSTGYDFYNKRELVSNYKTPPEETKKIIAQPDIKETATEEKADIGGPSQPEMASFKSAGTNDMVNLFTGDFSYNIPLLDVGGYPVNLFYNGGVTMEQEASWVGLGWNVNPGSITRNMRGVPDDFDGTEQLQQEQNMKKNVTWGIGLGADLELLGIKGINGTATIGYSLNNYLGPAIEAGIKGTASFSVGGKSASNKAPIGISVGLNANLNSRSGLTLAPSLSLSAKSQVMFTTLSAGVGVSTSYNSRSGIKGLQLYDQTSANYDIVKGRDDANGIKGESLHKSAFGTSTFSTAISFLKPSYVPMMQASITNSSGAGRFQLGAAMFGVYGSLEAEGYGQVSSIESADQQLSKPMIGYLYAENAKDDKNAVMDFTRFNDKEVTPNTTIISVPQYSYDVFSIQGEGTGGTIRAYRNDNGYVRDNYTASKDKSWSAGVDIGIPGHIGANFNTVKTPSHIGEWQDGNRLREAIGFEKASKTWENVYFRNPGENCVLNPDQYTNIGGTDLVRFKLSGSGMFPAADPKLQKINSSGVVTGEVTIKPTNGMDDRAKRTQVTNFLTAEEADKIGLDKKIKVYNADPQNFLDENNRLSLSGNPGPAEIDRYNASDPANYRKKNHISQINVTEADGKRYVYGIPVYNTIQKDLTFTVGNDCNSCDLVPVADNEASLVSPHLSSGVGGKDGYVQITTTPAYAHSFLLSGLLSPDYVDVNGDGITEDDLGTAVKFNYTNTGLHKWRTPLTNAHDANSNPGNLSETRDDKGIVSYGERETWYLQSVESKTMIAFFTIGNRNDGKGPGNESGVVNYGDNSLKKLERIDLYNKADLKKNGLTAAKPIKTVHFDYSYALCAGTPDNQSGGKLTLNRIWFTYNGQRDNLDNFQKKSQYKFAYTKGSSATTGENPSYLLNESDRWGNYKPKADNPEVDGSEHMKNRDYPYSVQDKTKADQNANAWALKKVLLPSGGQIEVDYESDDYAFVQNRRAAVMTGIIGLSNSQNGTPTANLYTLNGTSIVENNFIFIKVAQACSNKKEVYERYLKGFDQLLVKMKVSMPKGDEFITSYAAIHNYDVYTGPGSDGSGIWIEMGMVNDKGIDYSPLSTTAIEYLRERLPGQAFGGYDVSEGGSLEKLQGMFEGLIDGIKSAFSRIPQYLREQGKSQKLVLDESFVRLNAADGFKYGGGQRVKRITLKDNWKQMTNPGDPTKGYTSFYGQEYNYKTTEIFNGAEREISSGVASYEPSIGGEENPFQSIVQVADKVPFGPTSYGAIEMPVMDAFFPAPLVGYSKVTVTSIGKQQNPHPEKKTRSGVGRQVTEFFTAKDFPVYYDYTTLDAGSDLQEHENPTLTFFYKHAFDARAISQGFLVATNDMHGKMKSQASYAENDPKEQVSYTENFYRNTGVKGMDEKFDFVHNEEGGKIIPGNMGIDIELMTDTREFSMKTHSFEIQAQVDWMLPAPFPLWLPFIWPVSSESENTYRAITTTKVINYHSVLDHVVAIDKGSQVSTQNLAYDAETGQVVLNQTNNEFDKPIYSVSYPAYWAYSGMGPAYKNINAVFTTGVDIIDGKITGGEIDPADAKNIFESGDELYVLDAGTPYTCDPSAVALDDNDIVWVLDKNKNSSSLTNTEPDFIFINKNGKPVNQTGITFRIVRSGKRNMLSAPVSAITLMNNPVNADTKLLTYTSGSKVVNASAVEYKEKWQTDNDAFHKYKIVTNPATCEVSEVEDCTGYLEKSINPYLKGLLGNFRGYRNMVFYGNRVETDPTTPTNLPENGFLTGFDPYWNFNADKNLVPDHSNTKWVWNTESTRFNSKGMELETKNALEIYTAAQYGYSKTLPVAIANNSRYNEMFFEGFEDYGYNDLLNNSSYNNCAVKHIDFNGLTNSAIVSAEQAQINVHTGRYMLKVTNGTSAIKSLPIANQTADDYALNFVSETTKTLNEIGGNYILGSGTPSDVLSNPAGPNSYAFSSLRPETNFQIYPKDQLSGGTGPGSSRFHDYSFSWDFYINITVAQNYSFAMSLGTAYNNSGVTVQTHSNGLNVQIRDMDGVLINSTTLGQDGFNYSSETYGVFLCPGIYKVSGTASERYAATNNGLNYTSNSYSWYCSNSQSSCYKSLSTINGCTYSKPIAGDNTMLNPTFVMQSGKKMLFSGWVRENCSSPCNSATYTNNKAELSFDAGGSGAITLNPAGPIIEGWQRVEGEFFVPGDATSMTMKLINSGGGDSYWDDIRIHPFNANMKSYVYDPVNLRLKAELDANNYASFYEYDEEGTLIRTKVETKEGVKTISESRSAKQKNITEFQE